MLWEASQVSGSLLCVSGNGRAPALREKAGFSPYLRPRPGVEATEPPPVRRCWEERPHAEPSLVGAGVSQGAGVGSARRSRPLCTA